MRKDGIHDKVNRWLRNTYDPVLLERIPDDIRALVEKLK